VREVVYHEYVHQFFHMMEYDLPVWLNEGLADVLSTLRVKNNSPRVWSLQGDVFGLSYPPRN